jgi:hypothetical protein
MVEICDESIRIVHADAMDGMHAKMRKVRTRTAARRAQ